MNLRFLPLYLMACSLLCAQQSGRTLTSNSQRNALDIATTVYSQATLQKDPDQKREDLLKAAELFGQYGDQYPTAKDRDKALYMQAICLDEAGYSDKANQILGILANTMHGEYCASAAYKLGIQASDQSLWDKAVGYFKLVVAESRRNELRHDAYYRQGRAMLQQNNRREAETIFRRLRETRGVQDNIVQASLLALAQMKTEDRMDSEAYKLFRQLLGMKKLEKNVRAVATLQAARLASKLERYQEAEELYAQVSGNPDMAQYTAEAQLDTLARLYKKKDYEGIFKQVSQDYQPLNDPDKEVRRALIVGQSYMDVGQYDMAERWFANAEGYRQGSPNGAEAAYRRILCAQRLRAMNVVSLAQKFLSTYAIPGSPTEQLPICDSVRFIYADQVMPSDPEEAARQFDAIRIENLPAAIRADAEYKKAWTAYQGSTFDPVPVLNHFISTYKQDTRLPNAYALRGMSYAKQNKIGDALRDFDYVIDNYPDSDAVLSCWQKAAECCKADPQRRVHYYEGLVACGSRVKPAACAEAHYNIAYILYETQPEKAIPHFREAAKINPERYASRVGTALVQCYFKMQDAENLKQALAQLQQSNPASYRALPPAILRWCGWTCSQKKDYKAAQQFLTDALEREPKEKYTAADGTTRERPQTEPLVWKLLAHARLELGLYKDGYEAAQHYVSMETQPYRKAEGMRDMSMLLLGLKRVKEARTICENAIALGIDGPIKSSLFIALGDTCYADGAYDDAAKYYGRVANVVNDAELRPLATYKLVAALSKTGKNAEAEQYKETLKQDFPGWNAPEDALRLMQSPPVSGR